MQHMWNSENKHVTSVNVDMPTKNVLYFSSFSEGYGEGQLSNSSKLHDFMHINKMTCA